MRPVVRDTLSLRPQGFHSHAFLAARIAEAVCLAVITGIASYLLSVATDTSATLIVIILFSSAALLWTLLSWTGYSRRHLPYPVTWAVDLVFVIPFVILAIILGLPLDRDNTRCAAVSQTGRFQIVAPAGSSFGRMVFPQNGRAACVQLFVIWGVTIAVCVLFAVSALSVGFLDVGERQLSKAMFAMAEDQRGRSGNGSVSGRGYYYQGQVMEESGARRFTPTPRAQPGPDRSAPRYAAPGMNEYGSQASYNSAAYARPSIGEDRLNLNRPVTVGRLRDTAAAGGYGYDEPLGQPAAARMPRQRPDLGYGYRAD